jgi:hypothetical protein
MNRVTLAVVAVLLAIPAVAQAKAGIEFDKAIETQKPGDRQTFAAMVIHEPTDPNGGTPRPVVGVRPLVTFTNERTGAVMRVRTSRTDLDGSATGRVTFPDRGPWTASLSVGGHTFEPGGRQTFEVGPPTEAKVVGTMEPTPDPQPADKGDGGGFPAWLLSLPAAGLIALGVWRLRRRPRELGA